MFKFIYENGAGFTAYDRYFKYIEDIKHLLPDHIYAIASDKDRYDISNKKSLHDSWVKSIEICYINLLCNNNKPQIDITLDLLGAYHDRSFKIVYKNVHEYLIERKTPLLRANMDDLLMHEIRIGENGYFEHFILFDNDMTFFVACDNFLFKEYIF